MKPKEFKEGETVVYPGHGIGIVSRIERKKVLGVEREFYLVHVPYSKMNLLVPVDTCEDVGLRHTISLEVADRALNILENPEPRDVNTPWNKRYRDGMEKIKSGNVLEIAEVLRDLRIVKNSGALSFGERKLLEFTEHLFFEELRLVKNESEVRKYL